MEQRVRRETESRVVEMIGDVQARLVQIVAEEQRERRRMQEGLMRLMDDTCVRIN